MALIKILDLIVKGFEEFIYMVVYYFIKACQLVWSYRWATVVVVAMGVLFFFALWVYGIKTN